MAATGPARRRRRKRTPGAALKVRHRNKKSAPETERFFFCGSGAGSSARRKGVDRRKAADIGAGEPSGVGLLDAAEGQHGQGGGCRKPFEGFRRKRGRPWVTPRRIDRREQRDVHADRRCVREVLGRMARGGNAKPAEAAGFRPPKIVGAQMDAVSAKAPRQSRVAADEEENAPTGNDSAQLRAMRRTARIVIVAIDKSRPRRKRPGDKLGVLRPAPVGEEGEAERRGAPAPAQRLERARGGC